MQSHEGKVVWYYMQSILPGEGATEGLFFTMVRDDEIVLEQCARFIMDSAIHNLDWTGYAPCSTSNVLNAI